MRLIIDDQNDPNAVNSLLDHLRSARVTTPGGGTIGSRAVILVEASDIVRASKILAEIGVRARIE
jgi:hypothetical protein